MLCSALPFDFSIFGLAPSQLNAKVSTLLGVDVIMGEGLRGGLL